VALVRDGVAVVQRTTRITVETDTFLVIRRAKAVVAWCPGCQAEVNVITLTPDSLNDPATAAQFEAWLLTGKLHFWCTAEEAVQICVLSILQCAS
jgi:hypothetical protein